MYGAFDRGWHVYARTYSVRSLCRRVRPYNGKPFEGDFYIIYTHKYIYIYESCQTNNCGENARRPRSRAYMILYYIVLTGERYKIYNINMLFFKNVRFPRRGVDICPRVSVWRRGVGLVSSLMKYYIIHDERAKPRKCLSSSSSSPTSV